VKQELVEAIKALTEATKLIAKLIQIDNDVEEFVSTSQAVEALKLDSRKPLLNRVRNGTFKHGIHYRKVGRRNLQFNVRKCHEFFAIAPEKREWR
jgi:response regulator of citrate/malate metabolism